MSEAVISLPVDVEQAISTLLEEGKADTWIRRALALSEKYRSRREESDQFFNTSFTQSSTDVLGYLALRAPTTYAQVWATLTQIKELYPSWQPTSLLDIGSGPGTAIWAACQIWPSITKVTCLERDAHFIEVGKEILVSTALKQTVEVEWLEIDLNQSQPQLNQEYDLVMFSSVLNEMKSKRRDHLLKFAHRHCQGITVVVEPATPYGYAVVDQVGKHLASIEDKPIAPFIGANFYSTSEEKLHFSQKVKRPDFQRRIRQMQRKLEKSNAGHVLPASDWEEATYSYVASAQLPPEVKPWARVIALPEICKPYLRLKLLTRDGVETKTVLKRNKALYKFAKKLHWGDLIFSKEDELSNVSSS